MDVPKIQGLLNQIDSGLSQIEAQDRSLGQILGSLRSFVSEIRREVAPPPEDNRARTRDQISPREWAEYEWHDVTSMGDMQRQYIRGLKR